MSLWCYLIIYIILYTIYTIYSNIGDPSLFLYLFPPPPDLLHPVLVIHHGEDLLLVVGYRSYGDVSHYAELSTVVEMLILETNEVPHKSSEYLQKLKDTADSFSGNCGELNEVLRSKSSNCDHHLLHNKSDYPN